MSTVENFQNTAFQLFALTASMSVYSSYGYLKCLKLIYGQILRNLSILLAVFTVSTMVSTVNSTHYSTQSCFFIDIYIKYNSNITSSSSKYYTTLQERYHGERKDNDYPVANEKTCNIKLTNNYTTI